MSATLGFVSARVHAEHGYFGGYLVLNHRARPLEFHCTLPVKPSRAQTLLYGPTLEDFVCGEQIAKALITKAKIKPDLILVDSTATLAVSHVSDLAVAKLSSDIAVSPACRQLALPVGNADDQSGALTAFPIGEYQFIVPIGNRANKEFISDILGQLASHVDLREPFQRIAEALVEAHPVAKAG